MKTIIFMAILVMNTMTACKTKQTATGAVYTGPPTIVYKTKADYSKYVPVILSEDKTKVVSYPGIKDVYRNGKLAYPVALDKGYLLDNRGVGANSAFLKITYEDYAKLKEAPSLTELYNQILEKDPFTEIYNLGDRSRFKDDVAEINRIIAKGGLKKFTRIK